MPYCDSCMSFKEKIVESKFRLWFGYCSKLKVGRNIDNDICDKYEVNPEFEEVIQLRPEIKLEKLDDWFE